MNAVEVENLYYAYPPLTSAGPPVEVLHGINLQVPRGSCLALRGATGAGKTTLCLALAGLVPQFFGGVFAGRVCVAGLDTREHRAAELSRHVGLVFQDPEAQLFNLTVEDEVAFGLESLGVPRDEMALLLNWALDVVEMRPARRRPVARLSGGERKRVAIATVLAMRPEVLVLDEPTAGLDPIGIVEVLRVVDELRRSRAATIVIAEQDPEVVANLADRVVVLDGGRIALEGTPAEVFADAGRLERLGLAAPQVAEAAFALNTRLGTHHRFIHVEDGIRALSADLHPIPV
jgi:energy-coupling factor transporter ATP-binding protein EcfA2